MFDPWHCPTCICGAAINPHGKHIFCCRRVSKKIAHDCICQGIVPHIHRILVSGGYVSTGSKMDIEPRKLIPDLPGLRPFDLAFQPNPSLKHTHVPSCPYSQIGFDVTITPPQGLHPSQKGAASSNQSAIAAKHLTEKEGSKLMREGMSDPTMAPV